METREICCVICPMSCNITVKAEGRKIISIDNYSCPRGKEYAASEYLDPVRTITSTVRAIGYKSPVIPVRTSKPVPKDKIYEVMEVIRGLECSEPFNIGRVLVENVLGTESNIVLCND